MKAEYIINLYKALSIYSCTKFLQISIPNLCKKSNRRSHRHTLSKLQAENKRPKNGDQHPYSWNEHNLILPSRVFLLPPFATNEEERPISIYLIQD